MTQASGEEKLDRAISYILIVGVIASVLTETAGIISYYFTQGNLSITFQPGDSLKGVDFFNYRGQTIQSLLLGGWTPLHIMGLGIVLLMITPYLRVVASVFYFSVAKNLKYLAITVFVLVVLTASLIIH
ncbi:MAG: DUF1634 domain-containing protein [Candidatus Bathyarchaeia archaeon]